MASLTTSRDKDKNMNTSSIFLRFITFYTKYIELFTCDMFIEKFYTNLAPMYLA